MTDINHYAQRTPGAGSTAAVGGGTPGTNCETCDNSRSMQAYVDDDCAEFQRIEVFGEYPAVENPPPEGRDIVIEVDHRGAVFEPKSMFLEALRLDGSMNPFVYLRRIEVDEDKMDCISRNAKRGVPVHVFSGKGQCCDGLKVCIPSFERKDEQRVLKLHIRVFGKDAGVVQGHLRGRCESCGYEKYCRVGSADTSD